MTKNKSFPIGATVKVGTTVRVNDVLTAPTTVVFTIQEPDGTDNTPSVSNPSTGVYTVCFATEQAGYHRYKIVTAGNSADAVKEGTFYIHSSGIA